MRVLFIMKKCLKIAAYVAASVIGAGFTCGKEIVAFLGSDGLNLWNAVICFLLFFVCSFVFLSVGAITKAGNFGKANKIIAPRLHGLFDVCAVFNGIIVLSAMLAAVNGIGSSVYPLGIAYGAVFSCLMVLLARKGKSRVMSGSFFLMFFVVAIIIAVSVENFSSGQNVFDGKISVFSCIGYVAMNTVLSAGVMVSEKTLSIRECAVVALISSLVFGGLIFMLGYALRCAGCENAPMPIFALSARLGKIAYYASVLLVLLSVTATSLTISGEIAEFFSEYAEKTFSLTVIFLVSLIVSLFGFERVVEKFYPIIGVFGAVYFLAAVKFSAPFAFNALFDKGNNEIHYRGKKTKNDGGHHDEVELKNLPAEDDKVSQSCVGNQVFAHNRAHPRKPDVYFENGNNVGKRAGKNKLV